MSPSQLLAAARAEQPTLPALHRFLEHNRQLRHKIEIWRTRSRRHDLGDLGEATAKNVFDGLVYALVTAGTFGWLWPA